MKFLIYALLVAAFAVNCSTAQRYNYTYGVGFNTGLNYSDSRELGIQAKNGTYSLFTDGTFMPNLYGDAGVFIGRPNSGQPVPQSGVTPNQQNPQQVQGFPQYNINAQPPSYNPNQPQVFPLSGQYNPPTPNYNPNQLQVYPQNRQYYSPTPSYNPNQPQVFPQNGQYDPLTPNYNPNQPQIYPQNGQYYSPTPNYNPNQPQVFPQNGQYNPPTPNYNPNQPQVYPQNGQYYSPTPNYNPNQLQNGQNYPSSPYQRQFQAQPITPQFGQNFAMPPYNPYQPQGAPMYGQNYVGGYPYQNQGMQYGQNYGVPAYNPNQPQVVTNGSNALPNASNQTKTGP